MPFCSHVGEDGGRYALKVAPVPLGRTNETFPSVWLSLVAPDVENGRNDLHALADAALSANTVIDISSNAALWGGHMRGTDATLMSVGNTDWERATDEQHAHDLVLANLIEILCAVGREQLDFFFLRVRQPMQEFQISGALIALESARQEGNVRFVGIAAVDAQAALSVLQLHDAFETVLVQKNSLSAPLRLLAKSRRVAVITCGEVASDGQAVLVPVSTAVQVSEALSVRATLR